MSPVPGMQLLTASTEDTRKIASAIAQVSREGDVVLLVGEMGSGKTVFVQGFGQELGVDEPITSPTFSLIHTYDTGRVIVHHADLYRLDRMNEVVDLALDELVERDGVLLVEWGEAAAELLGDHLCVTFERASDCNGGNSADRRRLIVSSVGSSWVARWPRLQAALAPWSGVR